MSKILLKYVTDFLTADLHKYEVEIGLDKDPVWIFPGFRSRILPGC